MLRRLAAEPNDAAYTAIVENGDGRIIRAIRGVGRAFIQGFFFDSLNLSFVRAYLKARPHTNYS
jgi:hypothetical protein